jgi:predicted dehydrogenase
MAKEAERRVRFAVVGAGNIAQVAVLPAFQHARESAELVAIISRDPVKRQELGARHDVEHLADYDQYEAVLRDSRADAVYIALPNHLHREYTERAARVGVHVLCEKPMALTVADCQAMIDVCVENNVKLMIAYRLHFEEANLRAMQAVREGKLGEAQLFTGVLTHQVRPGDIRTRSEVGGGALLDLGVYPINAARCVFDDEPIEVFAHANFGRDERFPDVDETVTALLRFPDGRLASFEVSQLSAAVSHFQVIGTKGDLRVESAFEYVGPRQLVLTVEEKARKKKFPSRDQFAPQLIYFARCIVEGLEPAPSGREGMADVRVVEGLLQSARTGTQVRLEPWERQRRPDLSQLINKPAVRKQEPIRAPAPSTD